MNRRGEAFLTKAGIAIVLFGMFMGFITIFMSGLATDYGRTIEPAYQDNFNSVNSDLKAIEIEAQQIQKNSGLDSDATDIAQAQGVLSASEKKADSQTIMSDAINTMQDILPFSDFVDNAITLIISVIFLGAIVYIIIGRWI